MQVCWADRERGRVAGWCRSRWPFPAGIPSPQNPPELHVKVSKCQGRCSQTAISTQCVQPTSQGQVFQITTQKKLTEVSPPCVELTPAKVRCQGRCPQTLISPTLCVQPTPVKVKCQGHEVSTNLLSPHHVFNQPLSRPGVKVSVHTNPHLFHTTCSTNPCHGQMSRSVVSIKTLISSPPCVQLL